MPADLFAEAVQSSTAAATAAAENAAAAAESPAAAAAAVAPAGATTAATAAADDDEDWSAYRQQQFPEGLAFHRVYRQQLLESLSAEEKQKLQVFCNLIYLRYPLGDLKRRQPHLFYAPEAQVALKNKQTAVKNKKK